MTTRQRPVKIPVYSDRVTYKSPIIIGSTRYMFRFRYVRRSDRWHFDIEDMSGDPIIRGIRIVTGWPLLAPFSGDDRLPSGEIICYRTDGSKEDPGLHDFGKNAMLVYFPEGIPSQVPDPPLIFEIV